MVGGAGDVYCSCLKSRLVTRLWLFAMEQWHMDALAIGISWYTSIFCKAWAIGNGIYIYRITPCIGIWYSRRSDASLDFGRWL